jgi:CheY-like chemotaxis protein
MQKLRVVVASGDDALCARTSGLLKNRGHLVVKQCASAIEALEACFEEAVDLAVVDEELPSISGTNIADILRDLRYPVSTVVLMRGDGRSPEGEGHVLDPTREGFEAALLNFADSLAPRRNAG